MLKSYMNSSAVLKFFDECSNEIDRILRSVEHRHTSRIQKSDGSYVTETDLKIDKRINDLSSQHFGYGSFTTYISEESVSKQHIGDLNNGTVVYIDPIDGTENYMSGLPIWAVGISVYHNGEHIDSMLEFPDLVIDRVICSECNPVNSNPYSRIASISSSISPKTADLLKENNEYRITGCSLFNLYSYGKGCYSSIHIPNKTNVWDFVPAINIIKKLRPDTQILIDGTEYDGRVISPIKKYTLEVR